MKVFPLFFHFDVNGASAVGANEVSDVSVFAARSPLDEASSRTRSAVSLTHRIRSADNQWREVCLSLPILTGSVLDECIGLLSPIANHFHIVRDVEATALSQAGSNNEKMSISEISPVRSLIIPVVLRQSTLTE
jgi:hypothetical protein